LVSTVRTVVVFVKYFCVTILRNTLALNLPSKAYNDIAGEEILLALGPGN